MKKIAVVTLCACLALASLSTMAFARSMTVLNKSDAELVALNISKEGGDNTSNMLEKPLAKGKSLRVSLDGSGNTGWNVLAIDAGNNAHVGEKLNFSGKSTLVIGDGKVKVQ